MASLADIDAALQRIAAALVQAAPAGHWQAMRLHTRYAPDASVSRHDFLPVRDDGSVDDTFLPPAPARAAVYAATQEHWDLSKELGPAVWSELTVEVSREGRVTARLRYADEYTPGDVARA